jgi:hypothetical protein
MPELVLLVPAYRMSAQHQKEVSHDRQQLDHRQEVRADAPSPFDKANLHANLHAILPSAKKVCAKLTVLTKLTALSAACGGYSPLISSIVRFIFSRRATPSSV